ncbi:MAG: hypothetical protein JXQ90_22220 [Cyclobacteriaceae bacterium]
MNLLDKTISGLILVWALSLLMSCEDTTSGLEVEIANNTAVKYVELELPMTNVLIDSLRTDHGSSIVIGNSEHELFGSLYAESYAEFQFDSGSVISDTARFDSLILNFTIDDIVGGEGMLLEFAVIPLEDELVPTAVYLSSRQLSITNRVAKTTISQVMSSEDTLLTSKEDLWGKSIFAEMKGLSSSEVSGYSTQIGIIPTDLNEALVSFNINRGNSTLSLYTSDDSLNVYMSRLSLNNLHHTYIDRNRSGSQLESLENSEEFELPDSQVILHPLYGVNAKFDLDPLKEFIQENPKIVINKAELELNAQPSNVAPIQNIEYFFGDETHGILGDAIFRDRREAGIISNKGFVEGNLDLLISTLQDLSYRSDISLFFEDYYLTYTQENKFAADDVVIISNKDLNLNQTVFNPTGTKVKVFYTSTN